MLIAVRQMVLILYQWTINVKTEPDIQCSLDIGYVQQVSSFYRLYNGSWGGATRERWDGQGKTTGHHQTRSKGHKHYMGLGLDDTRIYRYHRYRYFRPSPIPIPSTGIGLSWHGMKPKNWWRTEQNGINVWPSESIRMRDELRSKENTNMTTICYTKLFNCIHRPTNTGAVEFFLRECNINILHQDSHVRVSADLYLYQPW